jgi:hypothetical protein
LGRWLCQSPGPSAKRPAVFAVDGVDVTGHGGHHPGRGRGVGPPRLRRTGAGRRTNVRVLPILLATLRAPVIGLMGPGILE